MKNQTTLLEPEIIQPTENNGTELAHRQEPPQEITPLALLHSAIEKGADVAVLERMSALAERWHDNLARERFATAMAAAQAEMPVVVQDRKNSHTNSQYASFEKIQKLIKPVYLRHGFTVSFSEGEPPRDGWVRLVAQVRHSGHVETYHRDGPMDNVGAKGNPTKTALHGVASTATYLMRHLLCGIFSVTVAGEDDDGQTTSLVNEAQIKELNRLIDATETDIDKVLAWAQVESLKDFSVRQYQQAVSMLKSKQIEANAAKQNADAKP